jgi:hypothetical protein
MTNKTRFIGGGLSRGWIRVEWVTVARHSDAEPAVSRHDQANLVALVIPRMHEHPGGRQLDPHPGG